MVMFLFELSARKTGYRGEILKFTRRNCWQDKETEESMDHANAGKVRGMKQCYIVDMLSMPYTCRCVFQIRSMPSGYHVSDR